MNHNVACIGLVQNRGDWTGLKLCLQLVPCSATHEESGISEASEVSDMIRPAAIFLSPVCSYLAVTPRHRTVTKVRQTEGRGMSKLYWTHQPPPLETPFEI